MYKLQKKHQPLKKILLYDFFKLIVNNSYELKKKNMTIITHTFKHKSTSRSCRIVDIALLGCTIIVTKFLEFLHKELERIIF